ncbi:MAG: histidine triad nucleotide-binding protein [Gemmatimonadales bacterium]
MSDCLFCRIVNGEVKAEVVYRTPTVIAIKDINPQAPVHVLVIPAQHVESLNEAEDATLLGDLLLAAREVARQQKIAVRGYRAVINTKAEAGQTVPHIHVHVLGGRAMRWPPG